MNKRILTVLLMIAVLFLSLPLFATAQAEQKAETKKIVFMYQLDASSPVTTWHDENVKLYQQQHPDVTIDVICSSLGNEYLTQLTSRMASKENIDVLQGWTLARMEPFANAGRLMDLQPVFDADPAFRNFLQDDPLEATTFGDGIYGVPLELAVEGIFYNKAIFRKAGIDVPKTYEEFVNSFSAIRKAGYIPIALGNTDSWIGTIPYMMLVERIGGLEAYEKTVMEGTGRWTDEPFVEAAYELQRWMELGAFEPNVNGIPALEGQARFQNGEAAMYFMGSWSLPAFIQDLGDDLGMFNLPAMEGGKGHADHWLIIPNQAISIGANTKYPDVAVDFLKFIFSEERQKLLAKSGLLVTTKVDITAQEVNPVQAYLLSALSSATGAMYPWDVPMGTNLGAELNNATANFYDGAKPETVLENLQRIIEIERD